MIQVSNVHKQFAGQILFENLSFNLQKGDRIGFVGRNGSGKSTLFGIITGKILPDQGAVSFPKGYKIGSLEQHIHFTQKTVLEECCQVLDGENKFEYFRAEKILSGLGFDPEDFKKDPYSFSGGYQIRINLCKCLLTEPDLLLLDEPTNYLDIVSLRWLQKFLRNFAGEVILITHDREFMDSATNSIMGIYRKGLKKVKGNTSQFYQQMLTEDEIYEKTRVNQQKKVEHLSSFIERFGAKASKASQAQSKLKQLQKIDVLGQLDNESTMGLQFQYKECPGKVVMQVDDLAFSYSGDKENLLFDHIKFEIGRRDRIGIIGKNGKGKSTLLNILAGELNPVEGEITSHPSLLKGHLGQTNIDRLCAENTIIQEVSAANPALSRTAIGNICGSMMFEGELAEKKIKVLSGGERSRVLLGKILANPSNLLLLDEPTNHLDMEAIEVLKEELKSYPGAVVVVTHSEALLREVVDKLIIFTKAGAEYFNGNYDDFLEKIGWEDEEDQAKQSTAKTLTKKEAHAKRQEIIKQRSVICNPLNKELTGLETSILELEEQLEQFQEQLIAASAAQDNQLILSCSQRVGEIEKLIEANFERMESLESELNHHHQHFDKLMENI